MATGKGTTSRPARLQFKQKLVSSQKPISTAELLKRLKVSSNFCLASLHFVKFVLTKILFRIYLEKFPLWIKIRLT
jgi:hypothetical protein